MKRRQPTRYHWIILALMLATVAIWWYWVTKAVAHQIPIGPCETYTWLCTQSVSFWGNVVRGTAGSLVYLVPLWLIVVYSLALFKSIYDHYQASKPGGN